METSQNSLRKYESVIILHPDTTEADQKAILSKNSNTINKFGGSIHHLDTWGKRRLANPIKKNSLGIYFHATFEAKGDCIAELERTMKIDDKVLRFMHTRLDDRQVLSKYIERFKAGLQETANREKEREAKVQARRAAHASRRERY